MKIIRYHVGQYLAFLCWLVGDLYNHYRWRLSWVLFANLVGLAMQFGSLFIGYQYARALENNATFSWLEWEFVPRSSFTLLIAVASVVMLLIIVSATLVMSGRREGLQLARDYSDYCSKRVYVLVSKIAARPADETGQAVSPRSITRLARRDANHAGIIVRVLSFSLLHLGTAVVAGLALFYIDPLLSLIIVFMLGLTAILFYRNSIKGASYRSAMGTLAPGTRGERNLLENRVCYAPGELEYDDAGIREVFDKGDCFEFSKAFVNQRAVLEESNFLAQIVAGASIFLIILVQGNATIEQGRDWSALLIYLVAFGLFATNFARSARMFASINRFYPGVNAYSKFVRAVGAQLAAETSGPPTGSAIHIEIERQSIELKPGEPLACVVAEAIDNYLLLSLAAHLRRPGDAGPGAAGKIWLLSPRQSLVNANLRQSVAMPDSLDNREIRQQLETLDAAAAVADEFLEPGKLLGQPDLERIGQSTLLLLKLVAARNGVSDIIAIDRDYLDCLSHDVWIRVSAYLAAKILLLAYTPANIGDLGGRGESTAVFVGASGPLAWARVADLDEPNRARYLAMLSPAEPGGATGERELADDDMDEEF